MTATYAHVLPTLEDYDLKLRALPNADRLLVDLQASKVDGDHVEAIYVYGSGSPKNRNVWTAKKDYDPKRDLTSVSWRLSSAIRETITESGIETDFPAEAGVFWNYRGKNVVATTPMNEIIQVLFSSVFYTLSGANGTPTTVVVAQADRGLLSQHFT